MKQARSFQCDVGNWIFSKSLEFLRNCLDFFWIFRGNFSRNFSGIFQRIFFWRNFFGGIFLEELFWRIFLGGIFWEEFFVYNFKVIRIWKELNCLSSFWFLSRFCLNGEGGRRTRYLYPYSLSKWSNYPDRILEILAMSQNSILEILAMSSKNYLQLIIFLSNFSSIHEKIQTP